MRLLHPFMPFITEALWNELPHSGDSLMVAPWPVSGARDLDAENRFGLLIELVSGIRNARSESGVEPARWIAARFDAGAHASLIEETRAELSLLARIAEDQLSISAEAGGNEQALTVVARDVVAYLPLAGMIDLDGERDRLRKEIDAATAEAGRAQAMLGNESFVARAPEKVVEVQRQRLAAANAQIDVLTRRLTELG